MYVYRTLRAVALTLRNLQVAINVAADSLGHKAKAAAHAYYDAQIEASHRIADKLQEAMERAQGDWEDHLYDHTDLTDDVHEARTMMDREVL